MISLNFIHDSFFFQGLRRMMVKKMNEANQVAQFGYGDEICMDRLIDLRKEIQPAGKLGPGKLCLIKSILGLFFFCGISMISL